MGAMKKDFLAIHARKYELAEALVHKGFRGMLFLMTKEELSSLTQDLWVETAERDPAFGPREENPNGGSH